MQWNLIRERKEHGETQKDIAALLKISENAYRLKEKGENQFKSDEMFLIADHYNKSISDILFAHEVHDTQTKCKGDSK